MKWWVGAQRQAAVGTGYHDWQSKRGEREDKEIYDMVETGTTNREETAQMLVCNERHLQEKYHQTAG